MPRQRALAEDLEYLVAVGVEQHGALGEVCGGGVIPFAQAQVSDIDQLVRGTSKAFGILEQELGAEMVARVEACDGEAVERVGILGVFRRDVFGEAEGFLLRFLALPARLQRIAQHLADQRIVGLHIGGVAGDLQPFLPVLAVEMTVGQQGERARIIGVVAQHRAQARFRALIVPRAHQGEDSAFVRGALIRVHAYLPCFSRKAVTSS